MSSLHDSEGSATVKKMSASLFRALVVSGGAEEKGVGFSVTFSGSGKGVDRAVSMLVRVEIDG